MQALKDFLHAIQFFTRIPVVGKLAAWVGFTERMQARALAYFPLIGALIGLSTAALLMGVNFILPALTTAPWIAALFSTFLGLMLTGAMHEDGLADLVDGLGGSHSKERALEIMKDSRIGAYGVLALIITLISKIVFLVALTEINVLFAGLTLFAGHLVSRFMPVCVVRLLPYVGNLTHSKSSLVVSQRSVIWLAGFWTLLGITLLFYVAPSYVWFGGLSGCLIFFVIIYRLMIRRLDGYNGDALGAVQQVCELGFYFGTLVSVPFVPL